MKKKKIASVAYMMITSTSIFAQYAPGSIVEENIDTFLAEPAVGAKTTIPVIILRYLPTNDGINLDVSKATDFYSLGEITLTQLKRNIDAYNIRGKFMLEEGSRFRGYKDASAKPYLGYKIVKSWTIYSQIPISKTFKTGDGVFYPDLFKIADDFNFKHYIEDVGVKEIWLWFGQSAMPGWPSYNPQLHKAENFVEFIESNMSSPTTGDISNSYRQDDLPLYSKSYIVYCYNFRRTQAEMIHNHGHQLESIYNYVAERQDGTNDLFAKDFSGWGANYSSAPIGRAGDTHHPPNTTKDYDYYNPDLVSSDIEDWRPDASGAKKLVNMDTWGNINYPWPATDIFLQQRGESQWYIYWMQNMPGYQNMIRYRATSIMTNWWEFTADWDRVIKEGKGLYGSSAPPATGASVGVFRAGTWFLDANANGAWNGCQQDGGQDLCLYSSFGQVGDMPAAGNWSGGAKSSIGVLRSGTGEWFIDRNGNHQWDGCAVDGCYVGFGTAGDLPVAGDWNGTGFAKIGVFRNGQWFLDANGSGAWDGCGTDLCLNFGQLGDWPVAGNWDGGLKTGVGVFRAGTWYLDYNGNGVWDGCQQDGGQDLCLYGSFGQAGDLPVAGDWNGDGKAKVGVFRNGTWYLDYNGNGKWDGCVVDRCYEGSFGIKGDLPVAGRW